jgi:hypothetical protein
MGKLAACLEVLLLAFGTIGASKICQRSETCDVRVRMDHLHTHTKLCVKNCSFVGSYNILTAKL